MYHDAPSYDCPIYLFCVGERRGGVLMTNSSRFDAGQCRAARINCESGLGKRANGYEDLRIDMMIETVAKTVTALRLRGGGGGQTLYTSHQNSERDYSLKT